MTAPDLDGATHGALGVALFNHVWTLLEKAERSPTETDEMIHAAHASRFHWSRADGSEPVNLARGSGSAPASTRSWAVGSRRSDTPADASPWTRRPAPPTGTSREPSRRWPGRPRSPATPRPPPSGRRRPSPSRPCRSEVGSAHLGRRGFYAADGEGPDRRPRWFGPVPYRRRSSSISRADGIETERRGHDPGKHQQRAQERHERPHEDDADRQRIAHEPPYDLHGFGRSRRRRIAAETARSPSASRPSITPSMSSADRFWLSLVLASRRSISSSTPTIARSWPAT